MYTPSNEMYTSVQHHNLGSMVLYHAERETETERDKETETEKKREREREGKYRILYSIIPLDS